ncbi:MAG TPA: tetratricopeptide repeat protein, partial [Terriglobales bacterium]|nr:tetratricopeptide repeat protein [Terriglobales bacterium]
QLNNQHIASIYDILQTGTETLIVMEYVEGRTLRARLQQQRLTIPEFVHLAVQCCDALRAAHARGIIHCDIKPENIMLTADGEVKVLDFGIARRLPSIQSPASAPTLETSLHSFSGTPAYMAPELLLEKQPDSRADLFSLGVVFYEVLAGINPFAADGVIPTAERVLRDTPRSPSRLNRQVTEELSRIVMRLLSKKPAERYASADELGSHLRRLLADSEKTVAKPRLRSRRFGLAAAAILAIMVALASVLVVYRPRLSRIGTATAVAQQKQLAVLPFVTPDGKNRAFCDGLTETLTAKLGQISDHYALAVIPPSEARSEGITTVEQAHKSLGATLVLTGTLRQSGAMVRISYSLVDAASRQQIRGDSITSELSNPFEVEDDVVGSVLDALQIALQPDQRRALSSRGTAEPQAYDFYLQGVGYLQDYHKSENVDAALTLFRHALERDPKYGLAWAGVGQASWLKYDSTKDPEWARKAQQSCERAIQLAENASSSHVCLGTVYRGTGRYEQAIAELQKAVDLEPSSENARLALASAYEALNRLSDAEATYRRGIALHPSYWGGYNKLGVFYFTHARYPQALEMFEKVVELAPDNFRGYNNIGGIYLALDQYDKAIPALERALALRASGDSYSNLGTAYFYQHRFADAARVYEQSVKSDPTQYMPWGNLAEAYFWIPAKRAEAENAYRKAIQLIQKELSVNPRNAPVRSDLALYEGMLGQGGPAYANIQKALEFGPADSEILFKAAIIHKRLGNPDQALTYLQKCVAAGFSPNQIRDNPIFDGLHSDPRFQELTRK